MPWPPLSETSALATPPPGPLVEALAALVAAVLVGTAGLLGWWQLDAWQERRTAEARDLTQLDPVPLADVMGSDDPFPAPDVGRPVVLEGEWLATGAFWVSGREQDGREGYWQVVPWEVERPSTDGASGEGAAEAPAVLVVTGWAPDTDAEPPRGDGTITGWLQPPEGRLITDPDPRDDVVPQLRVSDAVQRLDRDLYSAYVVLDRERSSAAAGSLDAAELDALPEVGRFTALRNLLYALEWWVFAAFAAYVWWRWRRDAHAAAEAAAAAESDVAESEVAETEAAETEAAGPE